MKRFTLIVICFVASSLSSCRNNELVEIKDGIDKSHLSSAFNIEIQSKADTLFIIIQDSTEALFEDLILLRINYLLYDIKSVLNRDSYFSYLVISNNFVNFNRRGDAYNYKVEGGTDKLTRSAINIFGSNYLFYEISGLLLKTSNEYVLQDLEMLSQSINAQSSVYNYDESIINLFYELTVSSLTDSQLEISPEARLRALGVIAMFNENFKIVTLINDIFSACGIDQIKSTDPVPFDDRSI